LQLYKINRKRKAKKNITWQDEGVMAGQGKQLESVWWAITGFSTWGLDLILATKICNLRQCKSNICLHIPQWYTWLSTVFRILIALETTNAQIFSMCKWSSRWRMGQLQLHVDLITCESIVFRKIK
jgi:hypothetical protein